MWPLRHLGPCAVRPAQPHRWAPQLRFPLPTNKHLPPFAPPENSLGVVVCVAALVIFLFIKPSLDKDGASAADAPEKRGGAASEDDDFNVGGIYSNVGRAPLINGGSSLNDYGVDAVVPTDPAGKAQAAASAEDEELSFVDKLSPVAKTIFGITMSVVSGL